MPCRPLPFVPMGVIVTMMTGSLPAALAADESPVDPPSAMARNEVNVVDTRIGQEADASSHARTTLTDLRQVQDGEANSVKLHIGNVMAGGRAEVAVQNLVQRQSDDGNAQGILIGNAVGANAAARVTAIKMSQDQRGGGHQVMRIGNAGAGGQSQIQATHIRQRQLANAVSRQSAEAGTAVRSTSFVLLDDLDQFQQGEALLQASRIGVAEAGSAGAHALAQGIVQWQSGRGLAQYLRIGNAYRSGSTWVHASEITQRQSGASNLIFLSIGEAGEIERPKSPGK